MIIRDINEVKNQDIKVLKEYIDDNYVKKGSIGTVFEYDSITDLPKENQTGENKNLPKANNVYIIKTKNDDNTVKDRLYLWNPYKKEYVDINAGYIDGLSTAYTTSLKNIDDKVGDITTYNLKLIYKTGDGESHSVDFAGIPDTRYGVFSGSNPGLVPKPGSGDSLNFLKSDGTWASTAKIKTSARSGKTYMLGVSTAVSDEQAGYTDTSIYTSTINNKVTLTAPVFKGDLEGNVSGNISGDISGDVIGNLTGNVTGNVLGDVTGNVTGDLYGNADSATILKNTRKFSITIGDTSDEKNFNGSQDVALSINSVNLDSLTFTGKLPFANIPAEAQNIMKIVNNDTARKALTKNDVQTGDTVKVLYDNNGNSAEYMYYVKDDTKLGGSNWADAYEVYKSYVDWSSINSKPTQYTLTLKTSNTSKVPSGVSALNYTFSPFSANTSSNAVNIDITPSNIGASDRDHIHSVATTSANGFMSSTDKSKLNGIDNNANNYTHPTYTSRSSGFYKVTVDDKGHVSDVSNVTAQDIADLGVAITDTGYAHPSYTEHSLGFYKITVDNKGHVSDISSVTKSDITGLGIPAQDTVYTHPSYTSRSSGFYKVTVDNKGHVSDVSNVTKSDITGLGIPAQDTVYTHPTYINKSTSGLYKIKIENGHISEATAATKSDIGLGNVDNTKDANKSVNYATSAGSVAWGNVTGKPSTFTPASHTHAASDINSGTLSVSRGGTGLSSPTAGYALITNGSSAFTTRSIKNNIGQQAIGYTNNDAGTALVTLNSIAYWNGAYEDSAHSSNLQYCAKGQFGDLTTYDNSDLILNVRELKNYEDGIINLNSSAEIKLNTDIVNLLGSNVNIESSSGDVDITSDGDTNIRSNDNLSLSAQDDINIITDSGDGGTINITSDSDLTLQSRSGNINFKIDNNNRLLITDDDTSFYNSVHFDDGITFGDTYKLYRNSSDNWIHLEASEGFIFENDIKFDNSSRIMYSDKFLLLSNTKLGMAYSSTSSGNYAAGLRIGDISPGNSSYTTLCNDTICANSLDVKGALKWYGVNLIGSSNTTFNSESTTGTSYFEIKINSTNKLRICYGLIMLGTGYTQTITFPSAYSYIPRVFINIRGKSNTNTDMPYISSTTKTNFSIVAHDADRNSEGLREMFTSINWMSIGIV